MMQTAAMTTTDGKAIVRDEFGARQIEQRHETSASASSALATASINARYIVAERRPRDWDDVRVRLLKDCRRYAFAARAVYSLPRGLDRDGNPKQVEGLTVRFAEAAIRTSGNIAQETRTIFDDPDRRLVKVSVTDLESNSVYERDVTIDKTIERSRPGDRVVLAQRMNSAGRPVYIVACTDEELLAKEGAMVSKMFRTLALRFLPADITEECLVLIRKTRESEVRADPDETRKALADAFAVLGVQPSGLKEYLGHELGAASPPELLHLRGLYSAIKDGEVSWPEALAERLAAANVEPAEGTPAKASPAAVVADRIRKRQAAAAAGPAPPPPAPPPPVSPAPAKEPDDGEPPPEYKSDADEGA